jgi:flavin reductase (DIM6/NTAB) family NADH-FMN oxidoreductase RutF
VTIHREHPFIDPASARDAVRQLRGRLAAGVTLWTTGSGRERAGLTISSLMVANGNPPRVLGLLDPLSDLADAVGRTGTVALTLLRRDEHYLSEVFAGRAPAPGGPFSQAAFVDTAWGPVLAGERSWAGLRVETVAEVGWASLLTCIVEQVAVSDEPDPLLHHRGRYAGLG